MQRKLTQKERVHAQSAKEQIAAMYHADAMPDGSYWFRIKNQLVDMLHYGTTDGKPYVEPAPPIPDGYRRAVAGDEGRRDCKVWKGGSYVDRWESKHLTGKSPFVESNYYIVPIAPPIPDGYRLAVAGDERRKDMMFFDAKADSWDVRPWSDMPMISGHIYIVRIDHAPTDEEASRLPTVMVRDYEDRPWEKKVLVRVATTGFICLGSSRRHLEAWSFCRHLYPGE